MKEYIGVTLIEYQNANEELKDNISVDEVEFNIGYIIHELGGKATINKIVIEYYNHHRVVLCRQKLNAKLYRMTKEGMLEAIRGSKGVYTVTKEFLGEMK